MSGNGFNRGIDDDNEHLTENASLSTSSEPLEQDPEIQLREKVYAWTCLFIASTGFFFTVLSAVTGEFYAAVANAPIPVIGITAFLLRQHAYQELSKIIFLVLTLLAMFAVSLTLKGIASPVWHWTGLVPILFVSALGWRRSLPWMLLSGLLFVGLFIAPSLTAIPQSELAVHYLASALGCLGVTYALMARYQKVTESYRQQLASQAQKNAVLARVLCHDLSTPLQVISYTTSELERAGGNNDKLIRRLQSSIGSMTTMVSQTRDLIRARQFQPPGTTKNVSIADCVEAAISLVEHQAKAKDIKIHWRKRGRHSWTTQADAHVLTHQVIGNLLKNAVKFSHRGSEILISLVQRHNDQITVAVADRGIGIPKSRIDKIFDINESHSLPGTEGEKGSGFGLPIVASYVHNYGGKVRIRSRTSSHPSTLKGTLVQVWLPAHQSDS